eukprot:6458995-Amphidinium_carterae.1
MPGINLRQMVQVRRVWKPFAADRPKAVIAGSPPSDVQQACKDWLQLLKVHSVAELLSRAKQYEPGPESMQRNRGTTVPPQSHGQSAGPPNQGPAMMSGDAR